MFQPAKREQAYLKLALTGPSGSGKTLSALLMASGLGDKIAVVDTENGSASLYDTAKGVKPFMTATVSPPFTTEKYIELIRFAEKEKFDVLVIDSLTHAWSGPGGILEQKEALDKRGGNSYTNWAAMTPKHNAFMACILQSKVHIIATMRSKQDYVLQENSKGKQAPIKVGLAPQQRDGMEYEFTIVLDIAMNHQAIASKDRTGIFGDSIFTISNETGEMIKRWVEGAAPRVEAEPAQTPPPKEFPKIEKKGIVIPGPTSTDKPRILKKDPAPKIIQPPKEEPKAQVIAPKVETPPTVSKVPSLTEMFALAKQRGWHVDLCRRFIQTQYQKTSSSELDPEEVANMYETIQETSGFEATQMLDALDREDTDDDGLMVDDE